MWKHIRRVVIAAGLVGGVLYWLATQSIPAVIVNADSFIATNLKWFGWKNPPLALASTALDHRIAVLGSLLVVLGLAAFVSKWIEKRWIKQAVAPLVRFVERHTHHKELQAKTRPEASLSTDFIPSTLTLARKAITEGRTATNSYGAVKNGNEALRVIAVLNAALLSLRQDYGMPIPSERED